MRLPWLDQPLRISRHHRLCLSRLTALWLSDDEPWRMIHNDIPRVHVKLPEAGAIID